MIGLRIINTIHMQHFVATSIYSTVFGVYLRGLILIYGVQVDFITRSHVGNVNRFSLHHFVETCYSCCMYVVLE